MYRDRLTELRGGNQGYNQINDNQYNRNYGGGRSNYDGSYSSRNNGGGSYGSRNNGGNSYGSRNNSESYNSRNNQSRNNGGDSYNSRNNQSRNNGDSYNSRNNQYGYNSPPESPGYSRNGGGADVASQYSGKINNLNQDIKSLRNYVDRLDLLYNRNYSEVRRAENAENTRRITELEERITAEIQTITNQLKGIKAEAERISNPRDKRMVISQVNNTSNNLKKVFDLYNEKRINYTEQGRNKMIRQYQIIHKNATQEEAERYVDSHPGGSLQYSMLSGSKAAFDEAQQRQNQMEQINQSINELCDLFQDMNNMLVTQNETINIIEENVDTAEYNVEEASKELTKAIEIRKSSRKKLWIITCIIFVIIAIGLFLASPYIINFISIIKKIFGSSKSDEQNTESEQTINTNNQAMNMNQAQQWTQPVETQGENGVWGNEGQ
ncbi:t-SNARE [Piromyces finnis]|uniref:t-SNARE n=1 Tax=Piromyces finnis TaxID=1754191 RepID=A0A1Y1VJQ6_9FUNG|nr:t-SNARE [Piromyces finnis]|eukprot:ORX57292.1 t-SNARE [Piromyces finnis]